MNQNNCECHCEECFEGKHCANTKCGPGPIQRGPTHCLYCHLDFTHKFIAHFNIHVLNGHEDILCSEVKCKAYQTKSWPEINEMTIEKKMADNEVDNDFKLRKLNLVMGDNISPNRLAFKIDEIIDYLRDQRL